METFLSWFTGLTGPNPALQGLAGGVIITLFNMLGALLVFPLRKASQKLLDTALGFAAGVMLSACYTSLILPGFKYGGLLPVLLGIAIGAGLMDMGDHLIPHRHFIRGKEGIPAKRIKAVWLFIFAISLHNMPEGLAVGVGFGSGNLRDALVLMLAIGIQNVIEGLSVSLSALSAGLGSRFYATIVGIRSGLVELPLAFLGAWAVHLVRPVLPYAMGFAAGAMLYVISDEIVPETHRQGHERLATLGTIAGVIVMLYLDMALS